MGEKSSPLVELHLRVGSHWITLFSCAILCYFADPVVLSADLITNSPVSQKEGKTVAIRKCILPPVQVYKGSILLSLGRRTHVKEGSK